MRLFQTEYFDNSLTFPKHFSMIINGSSGVGKTTFIRNLIQFYLIDDLKKIKYFHPNINGNVIN